MKKIKFLLIALMFLPMALNAQTTIDRAMSVWARDIVNANFTSTFSSTTTNTTNIATNTSGVATNVTNIATNASDITDLEAINDSSYVTMTADTFKIGAVVMAQTMTVPITIGYPSATGTDFTWASAADHTAQNLDLGAIVPAKARVTAIEMVCTAAAVGVTDITLGAGNASAGAEFIVAISCDALNEVAGIIDPDLPATVLMDYASASNVWVIGDPTDNTWADMSAGTWTVYVTYIKY